MFLEPNLEGPNSSFQEGWDQELITSSIEHIQSKLAAHTMTSRLGLELNKTSPSSFRERETLGGQGSQLKNMLAFDVNKSLSFPFFLKKEKQLLPNGGEKMVIYHDTK